MTLNLLHCTNIHSTLQRMKMWFSSTRLDGVQTVTRVEQNGYEMLTNYFYHCFNHFCYQMREIRWVVHVTRLGIYKKNRTPF